MEEDDFSGVADLIPDGAVPIHSVRIVEFLDEEGEPQLRFKVDGDVRLATTIGVLAIVQDSYVTEVRETTS
jgi:hypothetical protein